MSEKEDGTAELRRRLTAEQYRVTQEAGDTAQRVLDLCIRAFDYLPPVDVTFGDYLRALVTADAELNPDDPLALRASLVESFLARGIYPSNVLSLNEESLLWDAADVKGLLEPLDDKILSRLLTADARSWGARRRSYGYEDTEDSTRIAQQLHRYARDNHAELGLQPHSKEKAPISVSGFHTMFRVGDDGLLLTEASVQFSQRRTTDDRSNWGGVQPRAGTTVIFSGDGTPRYVISKPLPNDQLTHDENKQAKKRLEAMDQFVAESDDRDPHFSWIDEESSPLGARMLRRYDISAIHQGVRRSRPRRNRRSGPHE